MRGPVALDPAAALETFERGKTLGMQGEQRQPQQIHLGLQGPRRRTFRQLVSASRSSRRPSGVPSKFVSTHSIVRHSTMDRDRQVKSAGVLKVIEGYKGCRRKMRRFHGFRKPNCVRKVSVPTSHFLGSNLPRTRFHPPSFSDSTSHRLSVPTSHRAIALPGENFNGSFPREKPALCRVDFRLAKG